MRKVSIFLIMLVFSLLSACGGGGGGDSDQGPGETNNAPVLSNVQITPADARTGDDLVLEYEYNDSEDDVQTDAEVVWYKDDQPQNTFDGLTTLPRDATEKDDVWYAKVRAYDGENWSQESISNSIIIQNTAPVANAGPDKFVLEGSTITLSAARSYDADGQEDIDSYLWSWEGDIPTSGHDTANITVTIPEGTLDPELTFTLTVTDCDGETSQDECTLTVVGQVTDITQTQAENVLYAAYAGIGYMSQDSEDDDDEALYNVMLDDVAALTGQMVVNAIFKDPDKWNKIIKLLIGQDPFFKYDEPAYSVSLHIIPQGDPPAPDEETTWILDMALTANFSEGGFPYNDLVTYYYSDTDDLVADMVVEISASQDPISGQQSSNIIINSLEIHMNADAEYASSAINQAFEVQYDDWYISYSVEDYPSAVDENGINLNILPIGGLLENLGIDLDMEDTPDHRLYTLDGGLEIAIGGQDLSYNFDEVKYGQLDAEGLGINCKFIAIEGDVGVPSLVHISSPASSILDGDFSAIGLEDLTNVIRRGGDGIWISGNMYLDDDIVEITFNNDGSADFDAVPPLEDLWNVPNWQDELDSLILD